MNKKLQELINEYPFLAIIRYGDNEFVCIIQNRDNDVTTIYDYGSLKTQPDRQAFLELGETWWWESNRLIPINIFLKHEWSRFSYTARTLVSKEVEIIIGHEVRLDELSTKRTKRRMIQLVKKIT